ncbi:MAG: glycosyltransferase family 2 protein [Balneolaceae bacterium]|nr:glycosyltransferase family 2 protein [Balneolaceae bacterium]
MNLPEILFLTLFVTLAPLVGYQLVLSLLALNAKLHARFESNSNRKFAIVVPAHNEEKIISKTIYSLSGLIYPKSNYDIFVIADNCTDNTAELARSLGVIVLERANTQKKGKGYALRWAFDQILGYQKGYDAIIVVDADSLISGNYLEVMNFYLDNGSRVIQSSDLVLPEPGNWSIEATRIGFLLHNYVKPLGRKVLNLNMGLRGNGMCFSTEVLREVPWKAWSLTEDLEYGLNLILSGIKIDFAPEATVFAQMPVEAKNAESQRSRWELGRLQIIRMYTAKFLIRAFKKRSASYFDVFIDLVTPPFVNMMLLVMISLMAIFGLWIFEIVATYHLFMWALLALTGIVYFFIGMYVSGADKNLYKSLLHLPVYIFWKIKVYINAYRKGKEIDWIRTERDN